MTMKKQRMEKGKNHRQVREEMLMQVMNGEGRKGRSGREGNNVSRRERIVGRPEGKYGCK